MAISSSFSHVKLPENRSTIIMLQASQSKTPTINMFKAFQTKTVHNHQTICFEEGNIFFKVFGRIQTS